MKTKQYLNIIYFIFMLLIIQAKLFSTNKEILQYTPYDDFPGISKENKPVYDSTFPNWAVKLYQYPVNFKEISKEFKIYKSQNSNRTAIEKYFKLWAKVIEPYTDNTGIIHLPNFEELRKQSNNSNSKDKSSKIQANTWSYLGPKETWWLNDGGGSHVLKQALPLHLNIYSFDVSKSNPNIIYSGTETSFINKSTDRGMTWDLVGKSFNFNSILDETGITSIAIDPLNPDIVYATSSYNSMKSIDGGQNWKSMNNNCYKILIDSKDNSKLYSVGFNGCSISTDGGENWIKKTNKLTFDIEVHPIENNYVYAITTDSLNRFQVLISSDFGKNFKAQNLPDSVPASGSGALLAVSKASPNVLYIAMLTSKGPYLYKGTLNKSSNKFQWDFINVGGTDKFQMDNWQGFYDFVFDVAPDNPDILMVGTSTLFKSTNGGQSFIPIGGFAGEFMIHSDIQDLKMLPNGEVWVSTDGGLTLSTDNFQSITNYSSRSRNMVGTEYWGFDQGWNEDLIVGGIYHNPNLALFSDYKGKTLAIGGGETPTGWIMQGKERHVAISDLSGTKGIIIPKDPKDQAEGRFDFVKFPNMDGYGSFRGNLVHHPNYNQTLYLGEGNSFWKSTDMGASFNMLYTFPGRVLYIQNSFSNPDVMYADVIGFGLYRTSDGGFTWESKPSLTSGVYGKDDWKYNLFFAISPYNENNIYACLQNGIFNDKKSKIYYSSNGGNTWIDWSGSMNEYLKCIVIQPIEGKKNALYMFTQKIYDAIPKIFYKTEEMADWINITDNFPIGFNINLALPFYKDSKIRVGGTGGVWETKFKEPTYPIINPWTTTQDIVCSQDTIFFDDHSILDHNNAIWSWEVTPSPVYTSQANERKFNFVPGKKGTYSIKLSVKQNGENFSKTLDVNVLKDCKNVATTPKSKKMLGTGWNGFGQLGDSTNVDKFKYTIIKDTSNWTSIASGHGNHFIATDYDGSIWSWGLNVNGQLGIGLIGSTINIPKQIGNQKNWLLTSVNANHSFAVKNDGSLWGWGENKYGELATSNFGNQNFPTRIGDLNKWKYVSAGVHSLYAIQEDGSLWVCGRNHLGQLGDSSNTDSPILKKIGINNDWDKIYTGYYNTFAIKKDSSLWAWGNNEQGILANGGSINSNFPIQITKSKDWKKVDIGAEFVVALKYDGCIWTWGWNRGGVLGLGKSTGSITIPTRVGKDNDWTDISAGGNYVLATKQDSTLWAWGENNQGQLGDNSANKDLSVPQMLREKNVIGIFAGFVQSFIFVDIPKQDTTSSVGYDYRDVLNAYPIPIKETVNITLPFVVNLELLNYTIVNSNGLILGSNKIEYKESGIQIDFSKYERGVYFVEFKNTNRIFNLKIIKE